MSRNKADEEDVQPTKRIKKDKDKDDKSRDKGKDGNDRRDVNKHPPSRVSHPGRRNLQNDIWRQQPAAPRQVGRRQYDVP
jgi:hypothetical protein